MSDLAQFFGGGFDTGSVQPAEDFEAIPPGKYLVLIEKAEIKATKAGTGHYLEITMSVLDGQFKGRKLWARINIDNPNRQAVEIGLRELAALGQAIGVPYVQGTEQLLNKTCIASVKVKDGQNEVRTYHAVSQQPPQVPPQAPAAPPQYPQQPPPYVAPPQAPAAPPQYPQQPQQYAPPAPPPYVQQPQQPAAGAPGKPPWAR